MILCSSISEIERNSKRRSWKKRGSGYWRSPGIASASSPCCLFSGLLYRISISYTPMFPTICALGSHISACDTAALRIYNLSIRLRHCISASSAFFLILLASFRSCSSTLSWSSSSIGYLSEAQVCFSSYYCYCCFFASLAFLASFSLHLLSSLSSLSLLCVYLLLQE